LIKKRRHSTRIRGIKDRVDKSMGIVTLITEVLDKIRVYKALKIQKKKNFHGSWESGLRVAFLTPVRGTRGRWGGWPPDWGG
jgi:hypothetical protein